MCAFDCGPIVWSKGNEFVQFRQVASRMRKLNWPYQGTPRQILEPFYYIALDYRKYPIRVAHLSEEGYTLAAMRERKEEINEKLDKIISKINRLKRELDG